MLTQGKMVKMYSLIAILSKSVQEFMLIYF